MGVLYKDAYVYLMQVIHAPNVIKIGRSIYPNHRAKELRWQWGGVTHDVLMAYKSDDAPAYEFAVHNALAHRRYQTYIEATGMIGRPEYFWLTKDELIELCVRMFYDLEWMNWNHPRMDCDYWVERDMDIRSVMRRARTLEREANEAA